MQPGYLSLLGIALVVLVWLFIGMQEGPQSPFRGMVVIREIKPAGKDEMVTIVNQSEEEIDLAGWLLVTKPIYEYQFPPSCNLKPGQGVRVHSGPGSFGSKQCKPDSTSLYRDLIWTHHYVWCNQNGDTALLYDQNGERVDKYEYGAGWHRSRFVPCNREG